MPSDLNPLDATGADQYVELIGWTVIDERKVPLSLADDLLRCCLGITSAKATECQGASVRNELVDGFLQTHHFVFSLLVVPHHFIITIAGAPVDLEIHTNLATSPDYCKNQNATKGDRAGLNLCFSRLEMTPASSL